LKSLVHILVFRCDAIARNAVKASANLNRNRAPYNEFMFFRRQRLTPPTFSERLDALKKSGFTAVPMPDGWVRVAREDCAIDLTDEAGLVRAAGRAGLSMGPEIGALVDGGFQKFFQTPSGQRKPAGAGELKALHSFEEDLKEGLGEQSYYNDSLGTVSAFYLYDRVKDRDHGVPKRAWE
jgi:hypothetical protein